MASVGPPRDKRPPQSQAAVHPQAAGLRAEAGIRRSGPPPSRLPAILRIIAEHYLIAGPLCGVLGVMYGFHLTQTASLVYSPATQETVEQSQLWHGHFLRHYYITPAQHDLWLAMAIPAAAWPILLIVTLVVLGIRSHYTNRRKS